MSKVTAELVSFQDTDLVFGVVAPTGTNREDFLRLLEAQLRVYRYDLQVIRLSDFLKLVELPPGMAIDESSESARLNTLMKAGSWLRNETGADDILALMGIGDIRAHRGNCPGKRTAYVFWSLKHPDEISLLQQVYEAGFFVLGIYSSEEDRKTYLVDRKGVDPLEAAERLDRDTDEKVEYGQRTRDAFQLADVFIPAGQAGEEHLKRFLDLVFGRPEVTPTLAEHAMFLAYSGALRSRALARQVGAVVVSAHNEVLAIGANDAPCFGGGQYWPGKGDQSDIAKGVDANAVERRRIAESVLDRLRKEGIVKADDAAAAEGVVSALEASRVGEITEYGRDVHAEMEALLCCARAGVSVRGATLYTTTFPCHNCAKHLIGAGFTKVVFVEPYPKSKALDLHGDALAMAGPSAGERLQLEPFIGVGPRRYFDLFSLKLGQGGQRKRKEGEGLIPWNPADASPCVPLRPLSYLEREKAAQQLMKEIMK